MFRIRTLISYHSDNKNVYVYRLHQVVVAVLQVMSQKGGRGTAPEESKAVRMCFHHAVLESCEVVVYRFLHVPYLLQLCTAAVRWPAVEAPSHEGLQPPATMLPHHLLVQRRRVLQFCCVLYMPTQLTAESTVGSAVERRCFGALYALPQPSRHMCCRLAGLLISTLSCCCACCGRWRHLSGLISCR